MLGRRVPTMTCSVGHSAMKYITPKDTVMVATRIPKNASSFRTPNRSRYSRMKVSIPAPRLPG